MGTEGLRNVRTIDFYRQELKASRARLKTLNEQGVEALSRYDIEIASRGNAPLALRTAKWLVSHHIKYYNELIATVEKKPRQLKLL
jgi:hypothetical protein